VLVDAARIAFRPTRRNLLHWASWAVALAIQGWFVFLLRDGSIYDWEADLARQVQDTPGRYQIFDTGHFLTNTISWQFLPVFVGVVGAAIVLRHGVAAVLLVLTFPLHVLAQWPKAVIDRPRPPHTFAGLEGVGGLQSFPSGHAEFVVTFWGFVVYLLLLHWKRPWQRLLIVAPWLVLVLGVGYGRIAIGRHWPLDIAVSYVVGLGLLSGLVWLYTSIRRAQKSPFL
jgi:membrane-associated phospholipid phosphatase